MYVGHLRRKLDEPFGRRSIETVRGEGYRLRTERVPADASESRPARAGRCGCGSPPARSSSWWPARAVPACCWSASVEREMVDQIDTTLTANADFIDRSMASGAGLPTGEGPTDLYVQFVAPDGSVVGASTAAQGLPPLAEPQLGEATGGS